MLSFVLWLVGWKLDFCFFVAIKRVSNFELNAFLGRATWVLNQYKGALSLCPISSINQRDHYEEKKVTSVTPRSEHDYNRVSKPL